MATYKAAYLTASEVNGKVVISKLDLDVSTSQGNYVSSDDDQELEKFKIDNWKLFLAGKLEANKTFTDQTDNLTITFSFEFDDEACKKILKLDTATEVIHDHVLNIIYTRKVTKQLIKQEKCSVTDELNDAENKQNIKLEKCPVIDELNDTENKSKKKPLRPRNKCNNVMNPEPTENVEKVSLRKRAAEKKTEVSTKKTVSNTEVSESKKVKASKSDTKTKNSSSLSLRNRKQPTLHKFFATSPPVVKTESKMEEKSVPDAGQQPLKTNEVSKRKRGRAAMQSDFIKLEKAPKSKYQDNIKPETEVVCFPTTPKKEPVSAIANLQNIAKKLRTPVKSSTVFPNYDPKEDIGLDQFVMPVDEKYEADCATLKEAFTSGLVEDVDPELATRMFERNLPFLRAILAGEIYSVRHQEYHSDPEKRRTMDYAPGCIIIGDANLSLFMELMGDVLTTDNDDHRDKIPYFMLVLIPELITKIVMAVFNINKQEAVKKKKSIGILVTKNTPYLF